MNTIKQLAAAIGVPESTVRLYRDEFEDFLPASGEGRRRRYGQEALTVLRLIVAHKREGMPAVGIRAELARRIQPAERARRRTTEERLEEIAAALRAQAGEAALLRAEVGALRTLVHQLSTQLRREESGGMRMEEVQEAYLLQQGRTGG